MELHLLTQHTLGSVSQDIKGINPRQSNAQRSNAIDAKDLAMLQKTVLKSKFRGKVLHSRFRGKFLTAVFAIERATPQQNAGYVLLIMTNKSRMLLKIL